MQYEESGDPDIADHLIKLLDDTEIGKCTVCIISSCNLCEPVLAACHCNFFFYIGK